MRWTYKKCLDIYTLGEYLIRMSSNTAVQRVAETAKALAKAAGITQPMLARILKTNQATISRKLSGKIPFQLDELDAVADALNVEPEALITRNTEA